MPPSTTPRNLLKLPPSIRLSTLTSSHPFSVLNRPPPNYPGHVPLTTFERASLAVGSAIGSLLNPRRGDLIALLGETSSPTPYLSSLRNTMLSSPTGRRILRDRPRIASSTTCLSPSHLLSLPPNSLGRTYAAWLASEHVSPDTRAPVRYIADPELAYIVQRYRECHDFYHAVTGLPVWVEGEVALKAFEAANLGMPMAGLAVGAVWRLKPKARARFWSMYGPWAVRSGWRAECLLNVYWEECLGVDVDVLRREWGIEKAPDLRVERRRGKEVSVEGGAGAA